MLRGFVLLASIVGALGAYMASVASGDTAPSAGMPIAAPTSPMLPPELVVLEQKMGELQISSLRFSARTSITGIRVSAEIMKLLTLLGLDSTISGEATISPPASNVTLDLFGHPFTARSLGSHLYIYFGTLASFDHGRPWVKTGPGGLGELFTVNGHAAPVQKAKSQLPPQAPQLAKPPFASLVKLVNGAREVRELAPGVLDGQPVTRFLATLEPDQFKSAGGLSGQISRRRRRAPAATATLEVSVAPDGLPVGIAVAEHQGGVTTTVTLEIPAINFPLVIEAPPAAETITLREFRALEKAHTHHRRKRKS